MYQAGSKGKRFKGFTLSESSVSLWMTLDSISLWMIHIKTNIVSLGMIVNICFTGDDTYKTNIVPLGMIVKNVSLGMIVNNLFHWG